MKLKMDGENITTTVGELIKCLEKLDGNAPIYTEGCDCIGNVIEATVESDGSVLLCRDDSAFVYNIFSNNEDDDRKKLKPEYVGRLE